MRGTPNLVTRPLQNRRFFTGFSTINTMTAFIVSSLVFYSKSALPCPELWGFASEYHASADIVF